MQSAARCLNAARAQGKHGVVMVASDGVRISNNWLYTFMSNLGWHRLAQINGVWRRLGAFLCSLTFRLQKFDGVLTAPATTVNSPPSK